MKKQGGFGIIAAVFVILFLSMLTIFSASLFSTDIEIALDSLRSAKALSLCDGALNYCVKHELVDDTDWSDNTNIVDKPLGNGTFSIYYDPYKTTATKTKVNIIATVDNITRQITQSFNLGGGWPRTYSDFPYSLFTAGDLTIKLSPGLTIETPYEINNSSCPVITCDFDYYFNIADIRMSTDWLVNGDINSTYTGIYYVDGTVEFKNCDNIKFYGSIIATGSYINFTGCKNVIIAPSGNNPALVVGSTGAINIQKSSKETSENIDIRGMVYAGSSLIVSDTNPFSMTGILYCDSLIKITGTTNCVINGSIISPTSITFSSNDAPGPDVNWGSKILDQPPGFTWSGGGGITMGQWDEAL